MRTAGIALALFAALLFVPSAVQRIRRARTRLQRLQMRADIAALATAEMRRERDEARLDATYWQAQYHGGVDAIIDRLRAAAADETPTHDRLVLEAMERQFENGGGS